MQRPQACGAPIFTRYLAVARCLFLLRLCNWSRQNGLNKGLSDSTRPPVDELSEGESSVRYGSRGICFSQMLGSPRDLVLPRLKTEELRHRPGLFFQGPAPHLAHDGKSAVDGNRGAGDEVGGAGGEKYRDAGEIGRCAPSRGRRAPQNLVVQAVDLLARAPGQ